jgi:hypothetical protein
MRNVLGLGTKHKDCLKLCRRRQQIYMFLPSWMLDFILKLDKLPDESYLTNLLRSVRVLKKRRLRVNERICDL